VALELDPGPALVPELERVEQRRVERVEEEPEQPVVARPARRKLDEDRPQSVAEGVHALAEGRDPVDSPEVRDLAAHLHCEAKAVRGLRGPGAELIFRRQPVEGRVQLDARQPFRVHAQELARLRPGRVERRLAERGFEQIAQLALLRSAP